jgi:NADPH:quinone reductase-like Zn-dependent oxidoreductase
MTTLNPALPTTMHAVLLKAHGGYDQLEYREDIPVPQPQAGEVLIRVFAAGVNNTDINTRIGWYAKEVDGTTEALANNVAPRPTVGASLLATVGSKLPPTGDSVAAAEQATVGASLLATSSDATSWSGSAFHFPRIQGADACGRIVAVGEGVPATRIGERVLVDPILRRGRFGTSASPGYFGADCDGGFAQYTVVPAENACRVESTLTDVELASFPCSYLAAETMVHRANVHTSDRVLVTGASGGVGSAAVQLAKRRGAEVIAVASIAKAQGLLELGASQVIDRGASLLEALGKNSVDVIIDCVGGPQFPDYLELLKTRGRYAVAGAIGGPLVTLDLRTLYLKDLRLLGCTIDGPEVFRQLVGYVERAEIRPLVCGTWPLWEIVAAQETFLKKTHLGKLVLTI